MMTTPAYCIIIFWRLVVAEITPNHCDRQGTLNRGSESFVSWTGKLD